MYPGAFGYFDCQQHTFRLREFFDLCDDGRSCAVKYHPLHFFDVVILASCYGFRAGGVVFYSEQECAAV
jgi:hypothetical protein